MKKRNAPVFSGGVPMPTQGADLLLANLRLDVFDQKQSFR